MADADNTNQADKDAAKTAAENGSGAQQQSSQQEAGSAGSGSSAEKSETGQGDKEPKPKSKAKASTEAADTTDAKADKAAAEPATNESGDVVGQAPTGFATKVDPNNNFLDSFGRPNPDKPGARPTLTPDLAEPLHDPASLTNGAVQRNNGEITENLHSAMRSTGAANYGLVDTSIAANNQTVTGDPVVTKSAAAQANPSAPADVAHILTPEAAAAALKSKVSTLKTVAHNIGEVAEAPFDLLKKIGQEIGYLIAIMDGSHKPNAPAKAAQEPPPAAGATGA